MVDRQLEKYKLLEEVGQGGMAVVYRGVDTALNREVAVKILHPHLAELDESKQRFQREAHAVAKLRHENILEIYDYSGIDSPDSFIVTEFIHGQTLKEFLARNPISHPEIAAMIIIEVCRALGHAHSLQIIHRDIKPENIMIRDDGRVKLTDFGIAQMVDVQRLTVTGQLLGSPAYMAPEQVEGKPVDFRADVFSVGVLLYQLAAAELPFRGKNPHEVLKRIADCRFVPPEVANPLVGERLGRIIRKALSRTPEERHQRIGDLAAELTEFLAEVGISEPGKELGRYFTGPAEYSRLLQEQVVRELTRRGKAALGEGATPKALSYFDRVLCADPRNAEVLALLDQIARRRRAGRAVALLALIGAVGAGAYLVSTYWPLGLPGGGAGDAGDALVATRDASAAIASRGDATTARAGRPDLALRPDLAGASPAADAAAAIAPPIDNTKNHRVRPALLARRSVEIVPSPKQLQIWLNGKLLGPYGPDLRKLQLPPGDVVLAFRNDACCFEKVIPIGAQQRPDTLQVKLPWKPGRLRVLVNPAGTRADVVVGSLVRAPGQTFEIPIPSYSDNGSAEVEVEVSAEGFATATRMVTVRANTPRELRVTLERTSR